MFSGIPESRVQILKFIKDQNRELQNFIEATTEKESVVSEFEENEEEDEDQEGVNDFEIEVREEDLLLESDNFDSAEEEEELETREWEIK